jgi:hypothetical protein
MSFSSTMKRMKYAPSGGSFHVVGAARRDLEGGIGLAALELRDGEVALEG